MLDSLKNTINRLLRIHKSSKDHFATYDSKETLIETKAFLRKYVRLITGLFLAIVCVSYAFVRFIEALVVNVAMPFFNNMIEVKTDITKDITNKGPQFGSIIAFAIVLAIVYIAAWIIVRRLTGSIEVPQEERARRCPMCGEQILEIAVKCKHCGSTVGRERIQASPSASRSLPPTSSGHSHQRDERGTAARQKSPFTPNERPQLSRPMPQHERSGESVARRRASYYARRRDGRYHSRYSNSRNYRQGNDQQKSENARSNQPSSGNP